MLPTGSLVPAAGSVVMTMPSATVALERMAVVGLKPAERSMFTATFSVRPSTFASGAVGGPVEMRMVTPLPFFAACPESGV